MSDQEMANGGDTPVEIDEDLHSRQASLNDSQLLAVELLAYFSDYWASKSLITLAAACCVW